MEVATEANAFFAKATTTFGIEISASHAMKQDENFEVSSAVGGEKRVKLMQAVYQGNILESISNKVTGKMCYKSNNFKFVEY